MTTRNPATRRARACLTMLLALSACTTAQPARVQLDDASITSKIKAKLAADGDISPFDIDVTTHEGVVTLQGHVKKEETRVRAERYSRQIDGVVRVINLVKVGEMQP